MESIRDLEEQDFNFYSNEELSGEDIRRHMNKIIVLDDGEVCSVCLQDMNVDDHAAVLKCSHVFHEKCVEEWAERKPSCPLCRHDIRKENIKRKRPKHHDEELKGKISTHFRWKTFTVLGILSVVFSVYYSYRK
ncbi:hypothetical protein MKW98_011954 [Papaver atlanticum]|uniref:RING-type domain-containing protein n=1 Tax=Papaver atlanticum TaxID=357466 RepID=A0AAD4S4L9_9MAGN|nr:hypothetical protein MKW98_011954 [Papaver atlanticum]